MICYFTEKLVVVLDVLVVLNYTGDAEVCVWYAIIYRL